jgi:hypothetical protein
MLAKFITVTIAGAITAWAIRKIMGEVEAQRVRVKAARPQPGNEVRPLRQDPQTGVYYPAD